MKNIYPYIDLEFLTDDQKGFKYNFVVQPGGDLSVIRIKITGPEIDLSTSGSLHLKTTLGTIEEEIPDCKFEQNDFETVIGCQFKKISTDVFGFSLQNEIPDNSTIIIDPIPQRLWGTYYGGTSNTACYGGTADADSNVIICGFTNSSNYIATAGAFQTNLRDGENAFLAKFNTNGEIVWATYYGGFGTQGNACITDHANNIFLYGYTMSINYIATTGSYQTKYAGGQNDCFLVKFTPAGQRVWGTYYGGTGSDQGTYCNIDTLANILVTGNTTSNNGIATPGAFKTSKSGYDDTFLAKFDSTGTSLLWGTYYGGSSDDEIFRDGVSKNSELYISGQSMSTNNIATTGSYQPSLHGGEGAFLAKFDTNGNRLWGTYFGGDSTEWGALGAINDSGYIYIDGSTESSNLIATPVNGGTNPAYQWKVNGVNAGTNSTTYSYNPLNGDSVRCVMTSNLNCVSGNPATSNTIIMSGTLASIVTFTACFDTITTTNAKPFKLKGGIPLGGTYSGPGVTNGIFYPAIGGVGAHQITYTYTNAALYSVNAFVTIVTIVPTVTNCGQILTDIRDGKTYPTVQIGSQCWIAEDLNYGIEIPADIDQRDNCIPEKYHNPASGILHPASVYQWDELMQYDEVVSNQGLCPPGWHVPTEADWNTLFANYISNAFAASPLKYSGFSSFNALLSGARHLNKSWNFQGFATFFWSSTSHGTNKA